MKFPCCWLQVSIPQAGVCSDIKVAVADIAGHHDDHSTLNIPTSPPSRGRSRTRPPLTPQRQVCGSPLPSPTPSRSNSREPLYRTTSLETRSRSPSPHPTPTPTPMHEYYGSANLTDRSRSPSPTSASGASGSGTTGSKGKRPVRRLPATPQKPSSLNLPERRDVQMPHVIPSPTIPQPHKSPGSINFPRLNASPTHRSMNIPAREGPASRGPRPLYSPTERNDLNQPGSTTSSRETLPGARGREPREPRYAAQIMNNGRPDPRYAENRYRDGRYDDGGRPGQRAGTLPNGFKPGPSGPMRPDARGGGRSKSPPKAPNSDSDDEDWC